MPFIVYYRFIVLSTLLVVFYIKVEVYISRNAVKVRFLNRISRRKSLDMKNVVEKKMFTNQVLINKTKNKNIVYKNLEKSHQQVSHFFLSKTNLKQC